MANELFPVFLKTDTLRYLIVGGGDAGDEKLRNLLRHVDLPNLKLVSIALNEACQRLVDENPAKIDFIQAEFNEAHLEGVDVVIAATNSRETNLEIRQVAKSKRLLVNVVDTPDLCDFYLSSVVKKGDLKIAISTNGKSPTLSKRMREFLEEALPEEIDELIQNLGAYRDQLKGDLDYKIKKLNEITQGFK